MLARAKFLPLVILGLALPATPNSARTRVTRFSVHSSRPKVLRGSRCPSVRTGVELVGKRSSSAGTSFKKNSRKTARPSFRAKFVTITAIEFHDKSIEFEIDGGGTQKEKHSFEHPDRVSAALRRSSQKKETTPDAKGSKITLVFPRKLPKEMAPEEIKDLLNPVLDFSKQSLNKTGIEALPPEFQEAVKAKEARVGMDANTVLLALGQPNRRHREKNAEGVDQEDWIYDGRGRRQTLVTFEKDVVVSVRQY